ncbi:MAG: FHA domain-containing protein [Devosia sp.]
MSIVARTFLVAISLAILSSEVMAEPLNVKGNRDGLIATLTIADDDKPKLEWRFERALPTPITNLVANYNGQIIPVGDTRTYPQADDMTMALVIVDITGGDARANEVSLERARAVRIYQQAAPHVRAGFGIIDGGLRLLMPPPDETFDPLLVLASLGTSDGAANLQNALGAGIAQMGEFTEGARRTIFVLTDGHSDEPLDYGALTSAAKELDVSVNVIVKPGREADLEQLSAFARSTGGFYASGEEASRILDAPFRFVDSGATAVLSTEGARHYFWDKDRLLNVSFVYGDRSLTLQAPITVPEASLRETWDHAWEHQGRTIALVLAATGWLTALILMPFARWPRRRTRAVAVGAYSAPIASTPPSAVSVAAPSTRPGLPSGAVRLVLSEPHSGYSDRLDLTLERITIGRARDNTVVVPNGSVSGHHAVLVRGVDGVFSLSNLSETNPTLVNGAAQQFAALKSGDELRLGDVRVRFEKGMP